MTAPRSTLSLQTVLRLRWYLVPSQKFPVDDDNEKRHGTTTTRTPTDHHRRRRRRRQRQSDDDDDGDNDKAMTTTTGFKFWSQRLNRVGGHTPTRWKKSWRSSRRIRRGGRKGVGGRSSVTMCADTGAPTNDSSNSEKLELLFLLTKSLLEKY